MADMTRWWNYRCCKTARRRGFIKDLPSRTIKENQMSSSVSSASLGQSRSLRTTLNFIFPCMREYRAELNFQYYGLTRSSMLGVKSCLGSPYHLQPATFNLHSVVCCLSGGIGILVSVSPYSLLGIMAIENYSRWNECLKCRFSLFSKASFC
jgi:hypothetical protein